MYDEGHFNVKFKARITAYSTFLVYYGYLFCIFGEIKVMPAQHNSDRGPVGRSVNISSVATSHERTTGFNVVIAGIDGIGRLSSTKSG